MITKDQKIYNLQYYDISLIHPATVYNNPYSAGRLVYRHGLKNSYQWRKEC